MDTPTLALDPAMVVDNAEMRSERDKSSILQEIIQGSHSC